MTKPLLLFLSQFFLLPALYLYKNLEGFHKDRDTLAYLVVLLGRLNFVRKNSPLPDKDTYFLENFLGIHKEGD